LNTSDHRVGGNAIRQEFAGQHQETVVDVRHLQSGGVVALLVVQRHDRRPVDNVAAIPAVVVAQHGHQCRHCRLRVAGEDGGIGDRQERIAIKHEKRVVEVRGIEGEPKCAGRPLQIVALADIAHAQAPRAAIADDIDDLGALMADAVDDVRYALAGEPGKLV
jgi:hypothetical protein